MCRSFFLSADNKLPSYAPLYNARMRRHCGSDVSTCGTGCCEYAELATSFQGCNVYLPCMALGWLGKGSSSLYRTSGRHSLLVAKLYLPKSCQGSWAQLARELPQENLVGHAVLGRAERQVNQVYPLCNSLRTQYILLRRRTACKDWPLHYGSPGHDSRASSGSWVMLIGTHNLILDIQCAYTDVVCERHPGTAPEAVQCRRLLW